MKTLTSQPPCWSEPSTNCHRTITRPSLPRIGWVGAWHDQSERGGVNQRGVACTELMPWTPPSIGRHSMTFLNEAGKFVPCFSDPCFVDASPLNVPSQDLMWINRPSNLTVAWQRSCFPQSEWLEVALDLMKRVRLLIRVSNVKKCVWSLALLRLQEEEEVVDFLSLFWNASENEHFKLRTFFLITATLVLLMYELRKFLKLSHAVILFHVNIALF